MRLIMHLNGIFFNFEIYIKLKKNSLTESHTLITNNICVWLSTYACIMNCITYEMTDGITNPEDKRSKYL